MWIELDAKTVGFFSEISESRLSDELKESCKEALQNKKENRNIIALNDADFEAVQGTKWLREKIAFAEGKVIQVLHSDGDWVDMRHSDGAPHWTFKAYRIKPEKKPDIVSYLGLKPGCAISWDEEDFKDELSSIRIVRDGETGKLKDVVML